MRVLSLDIGDKRIGVAVSDELSVTAQGIKTIERSEIEKDIRGIEALIKEYGVEKLVIGLPKNMDGTIGPQGEKVLRFVDKLTKKVEIPITLWDERLTSISAERILIQADLSRQKRKKIIDKVAATLILQNYLDSRRGNKES